MKGGAKEIKTEESEQLICCFLVIILIESFGKTGSSWKKGRKHKLRNIRGEDPFYS